MNNNVHQFPDTLCVLYVVLEKGGGAEQFDQILKFGAISEFWRFPHLPRFFGLVASLSGLTIHILLNTDCMTNRKYAFCRGKNTSYFFCKTHNSV